MCLFYDDLCWAYNEDVEEHMEFSKLDHEPLLPSGLVTQPDSFHETTLGRRSEGHTQESNNPFRNQRRTKIFPLQKYFLKIDVFLFFILNDLISSKWLSLEFVHVE